MGIHSHPRPAQGHRQFNRLQLGVAATLVLTHESRPCLIDDISCTGARLRIQQVLVEQQALVLSFHELKLFSTVMWLSGGECGLRFDQPLDLEDKQGMLWIKENRAMYDRICQTGHASDWAEGLGDY